ncbi:MAG: hypothetical protein IJZ75_05470 [Clostridia bacterium]|nr:hypothetical protein [Clostridia bacterium]
MDEKTFCARVNDTATLAFKSDKPKFLGFLTEAERGKAEELLKQRSAKFEFFGGFEEADRVMLCCKPDWCDEAVFPITPVTATFRECDSLTHRDILGALMGLGITRESVGDILIESGRAVFFVTEEVSDFVISELHKAGRVGVKLSLGAHTPLPQMSSLQLFRETVASLRLDCVVSAIVNTSRAGATSLIEEGFVCLNGVPVSKATRSVSQGDKISIRGKGKFTVTACKDLTRKGRTVLEYSKYV